MNNWVPITLVHPAIGEHVVLRSDDWIDEVSNPHGIREGFRTEKGWTTAHWLGDKFGYTTDTDAVPTHWLMLDYER